MENLHHICYTPSCSIRTRKLYDEKGIISAAGCADRLFRWGGQLSGIKNTLPGVHRGGHWGGPVSSDIFADYDATIVNFWNNGCGTCIEEMPELEELYHQFQEQNINLIGVGTDSGEGEEQLETAQNILKEKGVTYVNISPDPEGEFYKEFISEIFGYPTTYIVDGEGNIIGAPIIGNVKKQIDTVNERLELISE